MMNHAFLRTKASIEDCKTHLDKCEGYGTPIESYLTQYLAVVLCADMEQAIYSVVKARCDVVADKELSSFAEIACNRLLRSFKKNEVAGFVGHFGQHCKEALNDAIDEKSVAEYDNAVTSRNLVAHSHGGSLTFQELEAAVRAAENIVDAVQLALQVKAVKPEKTD